MVQKVECVRYNTSMACLSLVQGSAALLPAQLCNTVPGKDEPSTWAAAVHERNPDVGPRSWLWTDQSLGTGGDLACETVAVNLVSLFHSLCFSL